VLLEALIVLLKVAVHAKICRELYKGCRAMIFQQSLNHTNLNKETRGNIMVALLPQGTKFRVFTP